MKCFFLFSAACMIFFAGAVAQQPDTARIMVHYKFTHVRDTTNRDKPYSDNTVLLIGKRASAYRRYVAGASGNGPGGSIYFQFPNEKKMGRKEAIITNDYLINEVLPVINWRITRDTGSFGGLHCQKATTHFKGRDYTAWFCADLHLPVGPWELNGLPGVIIEAYDSRKEVRFIFDGIEKADASAQPGNEFMRIKEPSNAVPATEQEFARLQETFRKDPDAFIRMLTGAGDGSGRQMHIDIKPGPAPVINNPIELTEKK